ncbi:MAG: diacylglycerol kinase [Treponema sp.]|nr:diacylglycerol kinase [Treponema sp.]
MDYFFSQALTDICEHSLVAPDRPLRVVIIVNPISGGFIIKKKWQNRLRILTERRDKAMTMPKRPMHKNVILNLTDKAGSAGELTKSLIIKAFKETAPFYLIISAGGDGTHCEIMYELFSAPEEVRKNIAILRLPMGTGDDGADSPHLDKALDLLINPVHVEYAPAVQLITSPNGKNKDGHFLAFNILSAGLDAYVTHMTNIMKKKTPGDSYKLWLDIATLFYETKFKVDYFDVRAFDENDKEIRSFKEKLLLIAMGASGHRSYGSQNKILPDDRNVCAVKKISLLKKLALKGQIANGAHADNPDAVIFSASRLEFTGRHPILAQMDGETVLLQPDDFPAVLKLTQPLIPLLKMNK